MPEVAQPTFPYRQHQFVAGVDSQFPVLLARDGVHASVVKASEHFFNQSNAILQKNNNIKFKF